MKGIEAKWLELKGIIFTAMSGNTPVNQIGRVNNKPMAER